MTFEELLKECLNGQMPAVIYNEKCCVVQTITCNKGFVGCGIDTGKGYVEWFHATPGTDRRKKYMSELIPAKLPF